MVKTMASVVYHLQKETIVQYMQKFVITYCNKTDAERYSREKNNPSPHTQKCQHTNP